MTLGRDTYNPKFVQAGGLTFLFDNDDDGKPLVKLSGKLQSNFGRRVTMLELAQRDGALAIGGAEEALNATLRVTIISTEQHEVMTRLADLHAVFGARDTVGLGRLYFHDANGGDDAIYFDNLAARMDWEVQTTPNNGEVWSVGTLHLISEDSAPIVISDGSVLWGDVPTTPITISDNVIFKTVIVANPATGNIDWIATHNLETGFLRQEVISTAIVETKDEGGIEGPPNGRRAGNGWTDLSGRDVTFLLGEGNWIKIMPDGINVMMEFRRIDGRLHISTIGIIKTVEEIGNIY